MANKGCNSSLFPMAGSQQRLSTGGSAPRKKVVLKPGRSLMDWIKLGRSGADLTGVGGQVLNVTMEELAKHNKPKDAWIAIRGKVYNITPYLEFHPGGQDELMRGAGIDGTQLFDEIHKWVNAESMLEKCFIGHLATASPLKKRGSLASVGSSKSLTAPNGAIAQPPLKLPAPQLPTYDWFQNSKSVTIVVYTRWRHIYSDYVDIEKSSKNILITVGLANGCTYTVHVELQEEVTSEYAVWVHAESGKVEITLPKAVADQQWSSLGKPLAKDKKYLKMIETETIDHDCQVVSVSQVTHDTKLLCIAPTEGCRHCVPLGHHVHVKHSIEGIEIARSYTAVLPSLRSEDQDLLMEQGQAIYLMIKIYPAGTLTPWIDTLQPGDQMSVSRSDGIFNQSQLSGISHLIMFAAGTGFTPMVRLIYHTVVSAAPDSKLQAHLLFYNKTEHDIMWREQLDTLAAEHSRFKVTYILSEADDSWAGLRGRVCMEHIEDNVPVIQDGTKPLVCVCGPTAYTDLVVDLVTQHGMAEDQIHAFEG